MNKSDVLKKVIELVQSELQAEFFFGSNGEYYIGIKEKEKRKALSVKAISTREYFHSFLRSHEFPVTKNFVDSVIEEFASQVVCSNDTRDVFVRVASIKDKVFIDRGIKECRAIVIDENGFSETSDVPLHFTRPAKQRQLPKPVEMPVSDFATAFKEMCNFKNPDAWLLVLTALLRYLKRSPGAYPIIVLEGPQGSGKTSFSTLLRQLIDPCEPSLSQPPKSVEDVQVLSKSGYLMVFDNLSGINAEMADIFCRISTGGGISKRSLYTNDDERTYHIHNPVVLNGIDEPSSRPDFVQRCLMIELKPLNSGALKTETELQTEFEEVYPSLLGGLYLTFSKCLKILPQIKAPTISRMGDYAHMGVALEKVLELEDGFFVKVFGESIAEQSDSAFWNDPLCCAVHKYFYDDKGVLRKEPEILKGTASELIGKLFSGVRGRQFSQAAPKTPKHFSSYLKRSEPILKQHNFVVEKIRSSGRREIIIKLQGLGNIPPIDPEDFDASEEDEITAVDVL